MIQRQNETASNIMGTILQNLPPETQITRIEYEGPRIALYTKNPRFLLENNYIISDIVNQTKKRVTLRTDNELRKDQNTASKIISSYISEEAGLTNLFFDDVIGEIVIEVKKPFLLSSERGFDTISLVEKTGWRIKVKKAPNIPSTSIQTLYSTLKASIEERQTFLRESGEWIFRQRLNEQNEVNIFTLGGFRQVGRSCIIVTTRESKIMLDCGIHPGAKEPYEAYPRLDIFNIDVEELDAVIISHSHLDHMGFLPSLFKYGYKGPVYCTEPTVSLMVLLLNDFIKVAQSQGRTLPYDLKDVREVITHCIPLPYANVTDISPDVKLVLNNAGHILGSATVHLHIGEGTYNIVYTGDFKFAKTSLFEAAVYQYPRVETLIIESTYGAQEDIMPTKEEVEQIFVNSINETLKEGGKVLIPVPAVGRAQEILLVLDKCIREQKLIEVPIFMEGMLSEATSIHIAYCEYLSRELKNKLLNSDENPFESEYFTIVEHQDDRGLVLREGPCIIMATSGMLEGGPVLEYFQNIATDSKNKILFVSYQISGTLGRRLLDGAREVSLVDENGKIKIVNVNCKVEKVEGFSGHSDYNQIIRYVSKFKGKVQRILVNHGERRKVENLANRIARIFNIPTYYPNIGESIKLL